jgi:glycosyltransferase involved in cell wall biosynthesis
MNETCATSGCWFPPCAVRASRVGEATPVSVSAPRGTERDAVAGGWEATTDAAGTETRPSPGRRPVVALVAHDIHDLGGMERVFAELVRHLHREVDFVVLSHTLADDLRPLVSWRRVPTVSRPFPLKYTLFFLLAGLRLLRVRADLVHTLGAIVPNRADLASVHFCHASFREAVAGLPLPGPSVLRKLNTRIAMSLGLWSERLCYRPSRLRVTAAVSSVVAAQVQRHYPRLPVVVTPNGLDARRFSVDGEVRRAVRASEGVADDEVIALFVGSRWEHKGLGCAIHGLRHASDTCTVRLRLWVAGRGDPGPYLRLARRLGVDDRLRFFGFRRDTEVLYQAADLFVLPSVYEASPLVVHEAAGSGLPVVATSVSGADLLVHERTGLVVDRDGAEVGAAMARLASDPCLRRRLGDAARSRVRELTWAASAASVLPVYRVLLRGRKPGARSDTRTARPSW